MMSTIINDDVKKKQRRESLPSGVSRDLWQLDFSKPTKKVGGSMLKVDFKEYKEKIESHFSRKIDNEVVTSDFRLRLSKSELKVTPYIEKDKHLREMAYISLSSEERVKERKQI